MFRTMTVLDRVRDFIVRRSPDAVCDDCIAQHVGITPRQHANHKSRELAGALGFERREGRCSVCGADKKVIRYT